MPSNKTFFIGGKHSIQEALKNKNRKIKKIILLNKEKKNELNHLNNYEKLIEIQNEKFFNKIFHFDFNHQGFAAEIEEIHYLDLETFVANNKEQNLLFVIIDNIFDDRNLGSIIRTSLAFYVDAIIINQRSFRSNSFNLYKNASGAMEYMPILQVSNIANAIKILKQHEFWIYSLDQKSDNSFYQEVFSHRTAFVFGSEDSGIKPNILNKSDKILNIPINKNIESLNVSNSVSASLAIYNFLQQAKKNPLK